MSLIIPFAVVFTAEHLHASGVVAVVVTGLVLGHKLPQLLSAASRLQIGAFWRLVRFLLEGLVFLLVGLQLREVVRDLDEPVGSLTLITFAVLATVFLTRFIWLFPATYLARLVPRVRRRTPDRHRSSRSSSAGPGCGCGDPGRRPGPAAHPGRRRAVPRALFIWLAFAVIVFTLVGQGATLPLVARRLTLPQDDPVQDALSAAGCSSRPAGLRRSVSTRWPTALRRRWSTGCAERWRTAPTWPGNGSAEPSGKPVAGVRSAAAGDDRRRAGRVPGCPDSGRIPEEVLVRAYRDLDLEESLLREVEK
ncbi:cation:proton antiporter [Micromonospora sp. M12]